MNMRDRITGGITATKAAANAHHVAQTMDAPKDYRKKPVTIQAIKWTGENLIAVITFTDGPPDTRSSHAGMMWDQYEELVKRDGLKIFSLEGAHIAAVGDMVIKGVQNEFYYCKPDVFAATYEPI